MDPISDTHHGGGGAAVIEDSAADDYVGVERPSEGVDDDGGNPNFGVEGNEGDEVLLGRNVVTLSCQNVDGEICDVWLIGTLHVSQDSCREVQAIISHLEPEIRTMNEMIDMWRKNQNLFGIIFIWFLAKVADKLEVLPGSEFRVAFDEAKKCCSKMFLGDRPVQITLWRTRAKMPLWHKIKLVHYFLFAPFFLPNAEDLNRMIKALDCKPPIQDYGRKCYTTITHEVHVLNFTESRNPEPFSGSSCWERTSTRNKEVLEAAY